MNLRSYSGKLVNLLSVTECKITDRSGDRVVYPIHSFDPAGTCFNKLFHVQQLPNVETSPKIVIGFKSFRFTTGDGDNESQYQKVSCKLHLNPATKATDTPMDCTCFNQSDCDTTVDTGRFDFHTN